MMNRLLLSLLAVSLVYGCGKPQVGTECQDPDEFSGTQEALWAALDSLVQLGGPKPAVDFLTQVRDNPSGLTTEELRAVTSLEQQPQGSLKFVRQPDKNGKPGEVGTLFQDGVENKSVRFGDSGDIAEVRWKGLGGRAPGTLVFSPTGQLASVTVYDQKEVTPIYEVTGVLQTEN